MPTIYDILRAKKGHAYSADKINEDISYLSLKPEIDKAASALAGLSRIHGDVPPKVQDKIIDILIEIGVRYKLSYRDIAHFLLICKIESGFNPDAAAGKTSAAGLGQYTTATIIEAAKPGISKKRLGFKLDLSGDYVFDAERGAYGVVLSFMIAKECAVNFFGKQYEKNLYLFHHQGWYFQPTDAHMARGDTKAVQKIINNDILPYLDDLEKLLSEKTDLTFKLLTKDDKPYPNQPYLAIFPNGGAKNLPMAVQGAIHHGVDFVFGKTDGEGKTKTLKTPGLSEVLFVVLTNNYKDLLNVNSNINISEKSENHLVDVSNLKSGKNNELHNGDYLWRRPPLDLVSTYLKKALNMHAAAAAAIVEHKRSHINLPNGNVAQQHGGEKNIIAIRGGATSQQVENRKKETGIPHKTTEKEIKKKVEKEPLATGTPLKEGLLFPLAMRPLDSYHTGARRFNSSRGIRRHAGCDLYAPVGTNVRAMADGVIIQCYGFYWKTDAIEVLHDDFIVRYGEVAPRSKKEQLKLFGMKVKRGDVIGQVGQLIHDNGTKHKDTMLHLEMFSSNKLPVDSNTQLSDKTRAPFQRRSDLIDPTATLDKCVME